MSDRRKKPQVVACWKYCDRCQCHYFSTEYERHMEVCGSSGAVGTTVLKDLPGTIHKKEFHGYRENLKGKGQFLEDTVILHPMTIQQLQMGFHGCLKNRAVLLQKKFIGYVKEDQNMSPLNIGLFNDDLLSSSCNSSFGSVTIEALAEEPLEVAKVFVESEQRFIDSENITFLAVIQQLYENKLVTIGSILPVKWLFSRVHLHVSRIVSNTGEVIEAASCNASNNSAKYRSASFVNVTDTQKLWMVTSKTRFEWFETMDASVGDFRKGSPGYQDIRDSDCDLLDSTLRLASRSRSSHGVLLYGPTGCGKKFLVRAAVRRNKSFRLVEITCSDIISNYTKGGGSAVEGLLCANDSDEPRVILLPHVDVVCLRNENMKTEYRNISRSLISAIDSLLGNENSCTIFVATAYRRTDVDAELVTSNRLSIDVEIKSPTPTDRFNILSNLLSEVAHNLSVSEIKSVSDDAHGFWTWHLVDLVSNAKRRCFVRKDCCRVSDSESEINAKSLNINLQDMLYAFARTREKLSSIAVKPVKWSEVGGRADLKENIIEAIEAPNKQIEKYIEFGMDRIKGILLYGPPGCSKTMIAKAIATQCSVNFFSVQGSELLSCFHGESERNIRDLFAQARHSAPSIIFFDEIDAIGGARGKSGGGVTGSMMQSLLAEMDGVEALTNVTIIAATNRPQSIDQALLRPGRLDRKIYVRLPDELSRREIFQIEFTKTKVDDDVNIEELVQRTEGFSCAEVVHVCNEARIAALREDIESATTLYLRHFENAFAKITPGTDLRALETYEKFEGKNKPSLRQNS